MALETMFDDLTLKIYLVLSGKYLSRREIVNTIQHPRTTVYNRLERMIVDGFAMKIKETDFYVGKKFTRGRPLTLFKITPKGERKFMEKFSMIDKDRVQSIAAHLEIEIPSF